MTQKVYGSDLSFKTSVKTLISYSILTRVVALLSNFVLAYYLGLSEYGKIVIYQAVWGIVSSLGHGGFYKLLFVSKAMAYSQLRAMNIVSLTLTIISILAWNYYDASFNLVASALFLISSVFYFRALPLFVEMERRSEFALSSKIRLSNQIIFSFLLLITSVSGVTLIYSFCSSLFISQLITYYHMRYKTHIGKFFNLSLDYKTKLDKGDIKDAAYNFFLV
ncbi:hypothetical protein JCM19241_5002 [Vibrio ishigakensis]|uniref:Polysaccharide biosynthesis protein n=1 Tax=Vibrio ishigakensis TaxID=1481914 RepID=A0A0B8Q5J6_9VIBR|nr:hypothetical protein JCM19241_5002 [Vibrio ishigakensis]